MANTIQLKRSAVASKVPTTTDLALGEIAINTYDGKMYIKKDNGTPSIIEVGGSGLPSQTGNSGKYLTTNGTTPSWANVSVSPSLATTGAIVCESDFIKSWPRNVNGSPSYDTVPVDGFYTYTSGSSYPVEHIGGEANHPGIIRMMSGNANMQLVYGFGGYSTSSSGNFPFITGTDVDSFSVITRRNSTNTQGFIGFMDGLQSQPNSCIGVYISSSTLYCRCANGGTATQSTLTGGMAANTWVQIDVTRNGSNFEFRRNGTLVQTITTNIPTTNKMFFGVFLPSASVGNQDIDYLGMKTISYGNRY